MSDYSIPNGDLKEVAEAFERITRGEVVAFRTANPRGTDDMQMVRGDLRKSSAYVALPVRDYEEGWALRKLAHVLSLDPVGQLKYVLEQLTVHPALFGSTEHAAALKAFKEATQEAVNNLARAEIDKQIHDAEAGIAYLKGQRAKLDKAGADAYEVFLRQPWPRTTRYRTLTSPATGW